MSCGTKNCYNKILFTCETCEPQVSFCRDCVSEHQSLLPSHKYKSPFLKIDKSEKDLFIISVNNLLKAVREAKKGIVLELKILMEKFIIKSQSVLLDLGELENLFYNAIQRLGEKKRINTLSMSGAEEFIVKMIEDKEKFEQVMKLIKSKDCVLDEIILTENCSIKLLDEIKKIKEKYSSIKNMIGKAVLESMKKNDDPPRINYFKENTKSLITVNVLENNDSTSPVSGLIDNLCRYSGYCQISDEKLFCYGGYNGNNFTNWYYLIDVENKKAEKLGVRKNIYTHSCCYHKGSVYVFGGYFHNTAYTNEVEVFNFKEWKALAPLPSVLGYNTTSSFGDKIALLGQQSINLHIYDISSNSYTLSCTFTPNVYKILISAKNKIYIFDNAKLYRLDFLNLINQTLIDSSTGVPNHFVIDQAILHKNNIYFILGNYNLYCFNLETEKARLLRAT